MQKDLQTFTKRLHIILPNKYFSKILFLIRQILLLVYVFFATSTIITICYKFLLKNLLTTTEQYEQYGFFVILFVTLYFFIFFKIFRVSNYFKKYPIKLLSLTLFILYLNDIFYFFIITKWEWLLSILLSVLVYLGFSKINFKQENLDKLILFLLPIFIFSSFFVGYYYILFLNINNFYDSSLFNNLSDFIWLNRGIFFFAPIFEEVIIRGFLIARNKEENTNTKKIILFRRFGLILFTVSLVFDLPRLLMNYIRPLNYNYINNSIELSPSLSFIHDKITNWLSDYTTYLSLSVSNDYLYEANKFFAGYLEFSLIPFVVSLIILIILSNQRLLTFLIRIKNFLILRSRVIAKIYYIISYPFIDFWINKNNRYMYAISTIYFTLLHLKWYNLNNFDLYYNSNYILSSNLHIVCVFILGLLALWFRVRINLLSAIAIHSLYNIIVNLVAINFVLKINNLEYNIYMMSLIILNILIILWFLIRKFYKLKTTT